MKNRKRTKIVLVVGARPNFMKVAPLYNELVKHRQFRPILVHTGQHYDQAMSDVFFKDLRIPKAHIYLGVGSGTHSEQTAKVMIEFEKILVREDPDLVIVVGDVNSTIACSLATAKYRCTREYGSGRACSTNKPDKRDKPKKLNRPLIAHVEAGLRSFDRTMPEEINRLLTDQISDYLFTTCPDADHNLMREGIPKHKIFFVGNTMIDTLLRLKAKSNRSAVLERLNLKKRKYAVLTLHRPSNVDDEAAFRNIMKGLVKVSRMIPIVFPAHPRTTSRIRKFRLSGFSGDGDQRIILLPPLGYLDFMKLMANATLVLTDSGGIQEETTILGIPCLTLRNNTERPITITQGTNVLVGTDPGKIVEEAMRVISRDAGMQRSRDEEAKNHRNHIFYHRNRLAKSKKRPKYWDGKAAQRITAVLAREAGKRRS